MIKTLETDWLASRPVFYNEKTGAISHSIHDVTDYGALEIHPEGLNNYLEFGYSVFNQTPVKHVKFLDACERITRDEAGKLTIEKIADPLETADRRPRSPEEALELIEKQVHEWETTAKGPLTIPLSGGYDSRLLASMVTDPSRAHAFTYGTSEDQRHSCEVVNAEEAAKRLGMKWDFMPLTDIQGHFADWDAMFGPAVHAHGMYHFDFFSQVRSAGPSNASAFLSGIIGDLWAGHVHFDRIDSEKDLANLARHHGVTADHSASLLKSDRGLRTAYFDKNKDILNDPFYQPILFARMKLILLAYLYQVPESFGFKPWSPFLDPEVAFGMLNLPADARKGRAWQKEYFASRGLDVESAHLKCASDNTLDLQAIQEKSLPTLDEKVLSEVIDPAYIKKINASLAGARKSLSFKKNLQKILSIPKIYGLLRILGMGELYGKRSREAQAYNAYCILKPIEHMLVRRDQAKRDGK